MSGHKTEFPERRLAPGVQRAAGNTDLASGTSRSSFGKLPERGEFVIRNAYVMTMDAGAGDMPNADVHVRKGEIVAVDSGLDAPASQSIDGRGMIVLPGLIETHWHMWNTLLRSMAGDKPGHGYFPTNLDEYN